MNDRRVPDPIDDEQLSAYLLGDLSAADAAALERALADDPQRAARLDALANAMAALGGVDEVELPDGFEQRLAQRLDEGAQVVDLYHERRARRTQWMAGAAAVAVMVFGAVFASNMLGGSDGASVAGDVAMDSAAEEEAAGPVLIDSEVAIADEAALQRRYASLDEVAALLGTDADTATALAQDYTAAVPPELETTAFAQQSSPAGQSAPAPAAPQAMTEAAADGDDATEQNVTLSDGSLTTGGGTPSRAQPPAEDARELSGKKTRRRRGTSLQAGGANVQTCLREITADATEPVVPVRIETLRYAGKPAFAYVLVTASPDSPELDRAELWVMARADCSPLVFLQY